MSEKKKRGEGGFHAPGTHPTNAMRANAGTGSYAGDSADRNERASGFSTFNDAKPSKFIPHAVRSAGLRNQGYTQSEARRIASFQTSTAGLTQTAQNTGARGELPDARLNPSTNSPHQSERSSGGALNSDMLRDQPGETEPQPTGTPAAAEEAKPEVGSDEWRKGVTTARTPAQQAQGNFSKALKDGTITPDKVKQAEAFAASKGWNFDAKKGYSIPENSGDPEGKGGTATFKMPDGSMREIGAAGSPKDVIRPAFENVRGGPTVSQEYVNANPEKFANSPRQSEDTAETPTSQASEQVAEEAQASPTPEPAAEQIKPETETEGFEKQDLEMLPGTVAGRARGAKAGNSYRSENGDVWRNDGEGGYNVEKAGGNALTGQQLDDFNAYSDKLLSDYKKQYPDGHGGTSNPKTTIDTRTVATIDQEATESPKSEPAVKSGKELKKEPTNMERILAMDAGKPLEGDRGGSPGLPDVLAMDAGKPFKGGSSDRIQDLLDMDADRNRPANQKPSKKLKKKLKSDSDFSEELSKIARKGTDSPNYIKAMTALAKQNGFDFNPDTGKIY